VTRDPSGEFNARFLDPENVARQFVPTPEFNKLAHPRHSVLLGPRGCGKTTLLKMLTRQALRTWQAERQPGESYELPLPPFEAIYIPTDVRWSYELASVSGPSDGNGDLAHDAVLLQRIITSAAVMTACIDTFKFLLKGEDNVSRHVCGALVSVWGLKNVAPLWPAVQQELDLLASDVRGVVNKGSRDITKRFIDAISPRLLGHSLDPAINACRMFLHEAPGQNVTSRWALCIDELELAPDWLRNEVFESLRSSDQLFYLKLTASPFLPSGLRTVPEGLHDYHKIRLWKARVEDARAFCEQLATRVLRGKFGPTAPLPEELFGPSLISGDDRARGQDRYERGGDLYNAMKDLATWDASFREAAISHGVNPDDPFTDSVELRDTFFRKVSTTVLLRTTFRRGPRGRSRKAPPLYSGTQTIYAMSDGNPRWLSWLLSELYDVWLQRAGGRLSEVSTLPPEAQARVLVGASRRFRGRLTAVASRESGRRDTADVGLVALLDLIGGWLSDPLLRGRFMVDPYGSIEVDDDVPAGVRKVLLKAVERGALIYVGTGEEDVPDHIEGSRMRLSFMLSPFYKLPLRNHRATPLSRVLRAQGSLLGSSSEGFKR